MNGMNEWRLAQKRPVAVEFRQVRGEEEVIHTLEGDLHAVRMRDLIVRGVEGEEYPVNGKIFAKTYDILPQWLQEYKSHEPFWKSDLVGRVWAYARNSGLLIVDAARDDGGRETLPPSLGDLVTEIRSRCDRCGKTVWQAQIDENESVMNPIVPYQCCHVHSLTEDYTPKLCLACHNDLKKVWPHATISV